MAPKTKPKPQSQPATKATVEDLFSSIQRNSDDGKYDNVVKLADQVLSILPGDEDALHCKVVALIKRDHFDRALSVIEASKKSPVYFGFYKAYCLYRQNKLHEAMETLEGEEKNNTTIQLESQILYRLGKMDACIENYEKLHKSKIDSLEMKINYIAVMVSAGRASEVQKMMNTLGVEPSSSFEMAYNTACSLIKKEKFADAEQQLLAARRIGQEMLMDDDFADDEIENELAPITVQLAYVKHLLGQSAEAREAYTDTINRNLADPPSLAVATNNLIALKGTKDVSDGLKKLDRLKEMSSGTQHFQLAHALDLKLSNRQKEAIYSNRLLLLLHANKLDQANDLVSSLRDMFPESEIPILLHAAVLVREKKVPKAEEILGQYGDKHPDKCKPVFLARAQIAATAGHSLIAAESLNKIEDIQHMPATVSTIVSLRERSNDFSNAAAALDSAVQWWKNSMNGDTKLDVIMHKAASFKLNRGQEEEAAKLFEELYKSHGSTEALVGLVTTAATTDIQKAEMYEKKLKPLPGLKSINVESLEKTSGAKPMDSNHLAKLDATQGIKEKAKSKKKRKRKPRYPKGFDPANPGPPPDPERWLPRRERSSYKPKRKDKRAQIRGAQGSVSRDKHEATTTVSGSSNSNLKPGLAATASSKSASTSKSGVNSERPRASKGRKKSRS